MRITSITESPLINTPIPPVKMSSLVAPPVGAFGTNQGTLGIQVNNAAGAGVAGIPVTITGPSTVTNPTNSAGCAIFAYVPVAPTPRASTPPAGSTRAATRTTVGATVSRARSTSRRSSTTRPRASTSTSTRRRSAARLGRPPRPPQLSATNGGVPSGPFSPFAGLRVYDPAGGAVGVDHRRRPVPLHRRLRRLRRRLPRRGPDGQRPRLLHDLPGRASSTWCRARRRRRHGPPALDQPAGPLQRQPAQRHSLTTRIVVTSRSTNCTRSSSSTAPSTDLNGYMPDPALPFGTYDICASAITPASATTPPQETLTGVRNWYHRGIKPAADPSPVTTRSRPTTRPAPRRGRAP